MSKDSTHHMATCVSTICDPRTATNAVAWFDLEQYGFTREAMQELVDAGEWQGPPPIFASAPGRDSDIWKLMADQAAS